MSAIHQLPMRFDYYLLASEAWANLLKITAAQQSAHITELCPGWSPKILMALHALQFTGTYHAIDLSSPALRQLERFAEAIGKAYAFRASALNILRDPLPSTNTFILNHVLDDLLLQANQERLHIDNLYTDIAAYKDAWTSMIAPTTHIPLIETVGAYVADALASALEPKGTVFLHQYPGYQEKLWNIPVVWELSRQLKDLIVDKLIHQHDFTLLLFPADQDMSYFSPEHLSVLQAP